METLQCMFRFLEVANIHGCFQKRGTPKWMVYNLENPMNKWMIWGYPYFWKHPHGFSNLSLFSGCSPEEAPKPQQTNGDLAVIYQARWVTIKPATPGLLRKRLASHAHMGCYQFDVHLEDISTRECALQQFFLEAGMRTNMNFQRHQ